MDYSAFVKTYYAYVINQLNKLVSYDGSMAMINSSLNVPMEYLVQNKNANNFFAPSLIVALNAPANYMEEFLNYYCQVQPDLAPLYLGTDGLRSLYSLMLEKNIAEGEEEDFISLMIEYIVEGLKKENILR